MTWLDKLERRLGFLGIPGMMRIVVAFNALVFLLVRLNPGFRFVLDLDPAARVAEVADAVVDVGHDSRPHPMSVSSTRARPACRLGMNWV